MTLSAVHTARLIWELVPFTHVLVPVLAKNTEKSPESPGFSCRNALSNMYVESYAPAARATVAGPTRVIENARIVAPSATHTPLTPLPLVCPGAPRLRRALG